MTSSDSPIIDYYPLDFALDGEGKRQDWEAVVVLRFVDIPRLKAAEESIARELLSEAEKQRSQQGACHHYIHDSGSMLCSRLWIISLQLELRLNILH